MINLNPIPKKIQERMLEKMKALGRETSSPLSNSDSNRLTAEKINSRTTFIKMVSGHINSVTLMGGRLTEDRNMAAGFKDIYGPVVYKETDQEIENKDQEIENARQKAEELRQENLRLIALLDGKQPSSWRKIFNLGKKSKD